MSQDKYLAYGRRQLCYQDFNNIKKIGQQMTQVGFFKQKELKINDIFSNLKLSDLYWTLIERS